MSLIDFPMPMNFRFSQIPMASFTRSNLIIGSCQFHLHFIVSSFAKYCESGCLFLGDDRYIPNFLQNAIFGLLLFTPAVLKKTRNRAGYYSLFSKQQEQKSNRTKHSILRELGYICAI